MLTLEEVTGVLAAIDLKRWGLRASIVLTLAPYNGGVVVGADALSEHLGSNRDWTRQVMAGMVKERVLIKSGSARGSKGAGYAVQPDVTEWRKVPWRVSAELVALRMFHAKHAPLQKFGSGPVVAGYAPGYKPGFVAGQLPPYKKSFVAGYAPGYKPVLTPDLSHGMHQATNKNLSPGIDTCGQPFLSPGMHPVTNGDVPQEEGSSCGTSNVQPSSSLSEELRRDVIRVCRLAYFRGSPAEHLAAFEREEGYESISRIIETAPIERRGPQSIVHYVGEVLAGLIDEATGFMNREPEPNPIAIGHPSMSSSPARPRLRDVSEVLASLPERKDHLPALAENYDQDTMSEEVATLETEVNR